MTFDTDVAELKGVGPALADKFAELGIKTAADLIDYYPRRWEDFSAVTPIARLRPGSVTIRATIKQAKGRYVRRGMHITEAIASDESSSVRLVWFNQPYRAGAIKKDTEYFISGNFELSHGHLQLMNPSVELVSDFPVNTARILPIYKLTKGLTSKQIRKVAQQLVPIMANLPETLPSWLVRQERLVSRAEAVTAIHFPQDSKQLAAAQKRLGFEEVFQLTLASLLIKREIAGEAAHPIKFDERLAKNFVSKLPFKLTNAQRKAVWQVYLDMQKKQPMNRLIEGDVGSGKTVVAAMAAVMALAEGKQVALMAPTEILAKQHADTIQKLLAPLGYGAQVGLLVGSMKPAAKKLAHQAIKDGKMNFVIGTHALIADKVDFSRLELVIVDEQHRFGVKQREKLMAKAGHAVHALYLTATPIPRSLALTLYGDLDLSVLDEKPPGRQPIKTEIISSSFGDRLFASLKNQLQAGAQMYVICPLIDESFASARSVSVKSVYNKLTKSVFKDLRVGLLTGKLAAEEKDNIMSMFESGQLDVLVSTTVVEVGVDVKNASLMVIMDADGFGLSQLHQLRGRIGRGQNISCCYLITNDSPSRRLRAMETTNDGFKLAELDLELRGPGAIYGTLQHGALDLKVANISDGKLVAAARNAAQAFIDKGESVVKYPQLAVNVRNLQAVTKLN